MNQLNLIILKLSYHQMGLVIVKQQTYCILEPYLFQNQILWSDSQMNTPRIQKFLMMHFQSIKLTKLQYGIFVVDVRLCLQTQSICQNYCGYSRRLEAFEKQHHSRYTQMSAHLIPNTELLKFKQTYIDSRTFLKVEFTKASCRSQNAQCHYGRTYRIF
ncbi:unnamed protein product [Paramecium octaurelia]|uniref:Uncharacterized protein n=1 Tax=Paramecium octaurelia TaxID=43137 RepID=A0A8S1WDP1_PAROT|nr:unnamed protein product [Paramecium octaurelia]